MSAVPYRLIRSRRRTLSIHITAEAAVEVRAPMRLPLARIEQFLLEKQNWIEKSLSSARERLEERQAFCPEALLYLGQECPIVPVPGKPRFDGARFLLPPGGWESVRPAAIALYRTLARTEFSARLAIWSTRMGIAPTGWSVTGAAKRWGSCSGKNRLSFSWRLVLAPPEAVDYVIVHELAHLRHHNHSAAFWAEVARWLPNYRVCEAMLRSLQERLSREAWEASDS